MVSAKILFKRYLFFLISELVKVVAITLALLHLPLRLFRKRPVSSSPTPRPAVRLTTHQPAPTYSQPRHTIVLIHGFPDSASLWDATVSRLTEEGYRCITIDLPGAKGHPVPYALDPMDTVKMIADALEPVCDTPFTLIGHDWGSIYSSFLRRIRPHMIHRLILLDVGMMSTGSDIHWTVWICMLSYQSAFALIFYIGEPCRRLQRFMIRGFNYHGRPLEEVTTDMCYHYAGMLFFVAKKTLGLNSQPASVTPQTRVPQLFVYGRKKLINFHDSRFVEEVRSSPCGEIVAFPCEHWIMLDLPEEWLKLLTEWLEKSETAIPQQ